MPAPKPIDSAPSATRFYPPSTANSPTANVTTPPASKTVFDRLFLWFMSFSLVTRLLVLPLVFMMTGALWVPLYSSLYLQFVSDLKRMSHRLWILIGNSWLVNATVIAPVLYVIVSIPFLRNLVRLYLEYKERRQTVDTGPRKSSSLSSKPMSSTERKFNYRVGARDASGSANTAVLRQFRPRPSLASSALLSPSTGTEQTVFATESGMASKCGPSTPVPPGAFPRSTTNRTILRETGSRPASRSTTPVRTRAIGVSTPDYSAAESLLLLRTGSRGRSNLQETPGNELSDVQGGSAEDRSTSTDGRDGTPLIPIPRRVRQKTPHHRVNFSEESSMSSPEADVAFDDSTDGSEVETTGVDTSNGSGSADMDIVTNSRIDRSIDTSSEDMDLVTLSPRSPESEPSFGNLPWTSTPQTNAPVKRDSEQDLSPSTNELFCVPTASERRANSKRTDVAVPLGRISVNPFIDTPGRQKGYGGAILAKGRTVVSVPRPQPEKKFRPKPHVVSQMQVAGRSAFTPEINRNLEFPASPAPEPFRPQALVFTARSTTRVSPPNGPRGPRGPHEMPRAFDTPEANANPGRRQVPPAANVTPLRGEVRAPAHSTPLPIRGLERSLGSSTPGTSPRPLHVPPSSSSPLTPWERARPEDLSASERRFQLENQTMFNDPTSPSPADWRRHPTPPRSPFEQVIRDSEPRPARRQQPAGPEPLEDDGVYWNG
ncbi:hypothetical protein QFC20_001921 [Naganishia adeliensis]|uniref:Uncharacterized protein n=1 Tax=Naganishia adeliensis TaxID=92952 RepID=A0ACC2WQK7_9TREE|nr:hypothetical protein QFC20_001921 [Naganishia adeliensis]